MIASCGTLGLDYERATLGEFSEAVEAHNEVSAGPAKDKPEPASDDFKAFMRGRFGRG